MFLYFWHGALNQSCRKELLKELDRPTPQLDWSILSLSSLRFDIYTFIEDLSADPTGSTIHAGRAPSSRGSGPLVRPSNATKSEQLDFFLRERLGWRRSGR